MILTLMLIVLAGAHLRLKLGPDLLEELVQPGAIVPWRNAPHSAMGGIHGHGGFEATRKLLKQ